jgi:hypothetical protein
MLRQLTARHSILVLFSPQDEIKNLKTLNARIPKQKREHHKGMYVLYL